MFFLGFVSQFSVLAWIPTAEALYPSLEVDETWGFLANEALLAGCWVVVSEAVGCSADFGSWERFRTISVGSAEGLANALPNLATYPRHFNWAAEPLKTYNIDAAAQALLSAIDELR